MSNDNGMVRRTEGARGNTLELNSLDDVARLAKIACDSGLVSVRKPEEAAVILLTGRELGLAPMQSLRGIYVVNGKPVLSADLLVAVVRRSGLCESWHVDESTAERCTITTKRVGEPKPTTKTWTMADAKRAGVTNKPIWQQYPAQMLRHRCAADLARECYSDVALGLYDPEEVEGVPRDEVRGTAYSTAPEIQGLDNVGRPIAPKSEPPRPSAFDVFAEALRKSMSLTDVVILWHQYAQALHNAGREGSADGLVSAWLEDHGHVLTATEQQAMLARGYTPDALYAIDGIAELKTAADVVQWRIRNDALLAQIGNVMPSDMNKALKAMAKDLGVPVVCLSQLSRKVEDRTDKRPMMSDLRESGAIEEDADVVAMVYRDEYYRPDSNFRGLAEILIRKNRMGECGDIRMVFQPEYSRFGDADRGAIAHAMQQEAESRPRRGKERGFVD